MIYSRIDLQNVIVLHLSCVSSVTTCDQRKSVFLMLSMSGEISADLDYVLLCLTQFYNVFSNAALKRSNAK